MALTATATDSDMASLQQLLNTKPDNLRSFTGASFRRNLHLSVMCKQGLHNLVTVLGELTAAGTASGIVYCATRADTEKVAAALTAAGISAAFYHAGVPVDKKTRVLNEWQQGTYWNLLHLTS
jgi:superfamily II DNA helicase RecQ